MSSTNTLNTLISSDLDNEFRQEYKAFRQQRLEEEEQMEKVMAEHCNDLKLE